MARLRRRQAGRELDPGAFAPRRELALYLDDTLAEALAATSAHASVRHVRTTVVGVRPTRSGCTVVTRDGERIPAAAAVLATGLPHVGHGWAPQALRESAFFVPDPWQPRALEIRGTAESLPDVFPEAAFPGVAPGVIRIRPRRILVFGLDGSPAARTVASTGA